MSGPWTFNVVYTPGTVAYLLPFVPTLLAHGDAAFRLVANGCLPPERRLLEAFAARHDRVTYHLLPDDHCLPHAAVLDALRGLPTPGPFCLLDSDIVASGPFLEPLAHALAAAPAVFSAPPVWLPEGDGVFRPGFRSLTGEYLWDAAGACVGGTYLAVYDPATLRSTSTRFGVSFAEYRWGGLPREARARLEGTGRRAERYDTGKALNGLLPAGSAYVALPHLHHLGGFSFPPLRRAAPGRLDGVAASGGLGRRGVDRVRRLRSLWGYRRFGGLREAHALYRRRVLFRDPVRAHFWDFLHALARDAPLPSPPATPSPAVDERVRRAMQVIRRAVAAW